MRRFPLTRRAFLSGLAGGGIMVGTPLLRLARAEPAPPPKRLLVLFKPCGTVPESYVPRSAGGRLWLSPILEPLETVRGEMTVVCGLDNLKKPNTPGQDHGNGMVTFMTGGETTADPAFLAVIAERRSIDQILARDAIFTGDSTFKSIQLAADVRSDRDELFMRVLSYAGRAAPLPPEHRPDVAFAQLFGELLPGGATRENVQAVLRRRERRQSVLDFVAGSLVRLSREVPPDQREKLETHLESVRELEKRLDHPAESFGSCLPDDLRERIDRADPARPDEHHALLGRAHLAIIETALACDLTRVATFLWAAGNSHVMFDRLIPGVQALTAHGITHGGSNRVKDEVAIHRWYSGQTAKVIGSLAARPDGNSRLLDHTLVVSFSEMNRSHHTFDDIPIQLFGARNLGLRGDRLLHYDHRSTNDLWLTVARALGVPLESFGSPEKTRGPLPELFG